MSTNIVEDNIFLYDSVKNFFNDVLISINLDISLLDCVLCFITLVILCFYFSRYIDHINNKNLIIKNLTQCRTDIGLLCFILQLDQKVGKGLKCFGYIPEKNFISINSDDIVDNDSKLSNVYKSIRNEEKLLKTLCETNKISLIIEELKSTDKASSWKYKQSFFIKNCACAMCSVRECRVNKAFMMYEKLSRKEVG